MIKKRENLLFYKLSWMVNEKRVQLLKKKKKFKNILTLTQAFQVIQIVVVPVDVLVNFNQMLKFKIKRNLRKKESFILNGSLLG